MQNSRCVYFLTVVVVLLGSFEVAAVSNASDGTPSCFGDVEVLSSALEKRGLHGLRGAAEKYAAPRIDSVWRLRSLKDEELRCQKKSRAFGREVLLHLNNIRDTLRDESGERLYGHVAEILDIGDWIGTQEGYGNALLQQRARSVVMMGLGRLVLDLSYPLERVRTQTPRLRGGLNVPNVRARILNREAGARLFPNEIDSTDELLRYWRAGRAKASRKHYDETVSILRQRDVQDRLVKMGLDPSRDEEIDAFFLDEECPTRTTLACWDSKRHEVLVGDLSMRIRELDALIRFREVVGAFPRRAARPRPPRSEILVAFDEAWEAKVGPVRERSVPEYAWAAFEEIERGIFGDPDLLLTQLKKDVAD